MTLERRLSTALERARNWVAESPEERARRALLAVSERDHETLVSLVSAYVTLHSGALSESSEKSFAQALVLLLACDYPLARLSSEEAALLLRGLEQHYKPGTVGVYKSRLKVFYDALTWAGGYRGNGNPFQNLKHRPDSTAPEDQFSSYDDHELRALLSVADPHETALLLLGAHAGLRVSEMAALRFEHLALKRGELKVFEGKGRKTRHVPLSATLAQALDALPQGGFVLPWRNRSKLSRVVGELCTEVGIEVEGKRVHGLRHFAGCKSYQSTRDIALVSRFLGHASLDTTMRYAKPKFAGFDDAYVEEFRVMLGVTR